MSQADIRAELSQDERILMAKKLAILEQNGVVRGMVSALHDDDPPLRRTQQQGHSGE